MDRIKSQIFWVIILVIIAGLVWFEFFAKTETRELRQVQKEKNEAVLDKEKIMKSVVTVVCETDMPDQPSKGSGVIVRPEGTVVTNAYVVDPYKTYKPNPGRTCTIGVAETPFNPPKIKYVALVQSVHHDNDLSFLKIIYMLNDTELGGSPLPANFDYLEYPSCDIIKPAQIGDEVYIAGYPDGNGGVFAVSKGETLESAHPWRFKTTAHIDYGSSGGAALNAEGKLFGIATLRPNQKSYITNLLSGAAACK